SSESAISEDQLKKEKVKKKEEERFAQALVDRLRGTLPGYQIETKKNVLYALYYDDDGRLQPGREGREIPLRGGGTGFQQDILVFKTVESGDTTIIPRVIAEVKFGRVTTHDSLVYSEK